MRWPPAAGTKGRMRTLSLVFRRAVTLHRKNRLHELVSHGVIEGGGVPAASCRLLPPPAASCRLLPPPAASCRLLLTAAAAGCAWSRANRVGSGHVCEYVYMYRVGQVCKHASKCVCAYIGQVRGSQGAAAARGRACEAVYPQPEQEAQLQHRDQRNCQRRAQDFCRPRIRGRLRPRAGHPNLSAGAYVPWRPCGRVPHGVCPPAECRMAYAHPLSFWPLVADFGTPRCSAGALCDEGMSVLEDALTCVVTSAGPARPPSGNHHLQPAGRDGQCLKVSDR